MTNYDILKEYEAHKTPVPSYEEYLESESHCAVYSEVNKSLKDKNAQLKELLKECKECISAIDYDSPLNEREQIKLLTKIDEALK